MKLKTTKNSQELKRTAAKAPMNVETLLRAELAQERGAHKKTLSELTSMCAVNEKLQRENAMLQHQLIEADHEAQGAKEDVAHLLNVLVGLRDRIQTLLRSTDVDAAIYDLPKLTISSEKFETAAVCDHKEE